MPKKKSKSRPVFSSRSSPTPSFTWIYIFVIAILISFLPVQNNYAIRSTYEAYEPKTQLTLPPVALMPQNLNLYPVPELSAEAIVVSDIASGVVLYEKNPKERLFPASLTKIMTALVALDQYKLDDIVVIKEITSEGQVMGLYIGESITVENLLYGILVHSANDAAQALAAHHPQGVKAFVEEMNQKAAAIHLTGTHFTNPSGLDDSNHYSTARDIEILSRFASQNTIITKLVGVPSITVSDVTFTTFHHLKNVNELLGKLPGVSGFKTGFTTNAGQSLVTTAIRNNNKVLIVLLKSTDRFKETELLINWVFDNHEWKNMQVSFNPWCTHCCNIS